MSTTTSSAPSSAATPATTTPPAVGGNSVNIAGTIVGAVLGGIIFMILVSFIIACFVCPTGRRRGRSKTKAPGWAKRLWNAEKSFGPGHDDHVDTRQTAVKQSKPTKAESKPQIAVADVEHGAVAPPKKKKKKRAYGVLPWGQHDAAEEMREQQERQAQQEQQQQQLAGPTTPQLAQGHGIPMSSDERQQYGYAAPHDPRMPPPHWLPQQAPTQIYYPPPDAGHQVALQQVANGDPVYYPPPGS